MDTEIFENVDGYIRDLVGAEDEILKATFNSTNEANIPPISVSANQGKFLQVLAKACNAKKILEIGTLVGYSTIWMARALPKDGKLISLEYEPLHARVSTSPAACACLALYTRPSARRRIAAASSAGRPFPTTSRKRPYRSSIRLWSWARSSGRMRRRGEPASLNAPLVIVWSLTPIFSIRPASERPAKMTPIEPTTEVGWATMRSAAIAA